MTKYVYLVYQYDWLDYDETYEEGVHKVFSTKKAAQRYIKDNKNTEFEGFVLEDQVVSVEFCEWLS